MGFFQESREVSESDGSIDISLLRQFESAVEFSIQVTSGTYICTHAHIRKWRTTIP